MVIIHFFSGMGPKLLDATGQGVLWGLMVLGVYITYKLLDIADLTVDGSFALGGCVCAMLIVQKESIPFWRCFLRLWPEWRPGWSPALCTRPLIFPRFWPEF